MPLSFMLATNIFGEKMNKWDAFISYTSSDENFVSKLYKRLKKSGVTLWFDREEIIVGENIIKKIKHGLDHSTLIVLFISNKWLGSSWCQSEMELMEHRELESSNTVILPFLLDKIDLDCLPGFLRLKRIESLVRSNIEKSSDIVRRGIQTHIARTITRDIFVDRENDETDSETPMFLAIDFPTGVYLHGAPSFWHNPPEKYREEVQKIGYTIMFPILDVLADWWLHNQVGMWSGGVEQAIGKAEVMSHLSYRTGFFLIAPDENPVKIHPLHGQVISMIVLHGCVKVDSESLRDLEDRIKKAHPNQQMESVRDNIGLHIYSKGDDCMPMSVSIAAIAHMYSKKSKNPDCEFKIDFA